MTNYEHYKDKIEKITRLGYEIAVNKHDNKPCTCDNLSCDDCIASTTTCFETISKWADEEYIEPTQQVDWSKVAVDTPILVSYNNVDWRCRHFAKYEDNMIYAWGGGCTSYTTNEAMDWKYAKLAEVDDGI